MGFTATGADPALFVLDTGAGPNLIPEDTVHGLRIAPLCSIKECLGLSDADRRSLKVKLTTVLPVI